ncbi:MAG: division/cell wall cluster transcriptional repressor MraZ [Anaerolineales bacterium]|nr:division/cell wall cluster transcriptional repressor MraZ [Anaerolineales bacterium]
MFLGQFYHNIDDKGRLTVPVRYREDLVPYGAYVMQGFERNLVVLPSERYIELSQRVNQMSMTDSTARLLRRLVFSTANRVELDKTGRILLPQFLREFAGLVSGTVIVGMGSYFEIWTPDSWNVQNDELMDAQSNLDRFSELNLSFT